MGFTAACYFGQLRASNYRGSTGIRRSWPLLSGTRGTRFRISRRVLFILRPRLLPPPPPLPFTLTMESDVIRHCRFHCDHATRTTGLRGTRPHRHSSLIAIRARHSNFVALFVRVDPLNLPARKLLQLCESADHPPPSQPLYLRSK